jgi:hypothetical protein
MELRMRWTMQVCTSVGGNTAAIALGNPLQAIEEAIRKRARGSSIGLQTAGRQAG